MDAFSYGMQRDAYEISQICTLSPLDCALPTDEGGDGCLPSTCIVTNRYLGSYATALSNSGCLGPILDPPKRAVWGLVYRN